ATINGEGKVAKIDLSTKKVVQKINTGRTPRSMALTDDGQFLYVVNYLANSMSKVATSNMEVLETVKTNSKPIGITIDEAQGQIWVACYTGSIMVFEDQTLLPNASYNPLAFEIEPQINALREHLNTQFEVLGLSNITSSVLESTSPKIPHLNTSESKPLPSIAKSSEITTTTPLPKPKTPLPSKPKPKVEVSKQYYLIAGSFDEGKWAADLVNKLKTQGFAQARILSKQGEKLRVCYSWHTTKEAADQEKERLKRELDLETWILVWE
ncbi:MAG: SPOR domain-containing protein, partial [Chitinophagales bacterium]